MEDKLSAKNSADVNVKTNVGYGVWWKRGKGDLPKDFTNIEKNPTAQNLLKGLAEDYPDKPGEIFDIVYDNTKQHLSDLSGFHDKLDEIYKNKGEKGDFPSTGERAQEYDELAKKFAGEAMSWLDKLKSNQDDPNKGGGRY